MQYNSLLHEMLVQIYGILHNDKLLDEKKYIKCFNIVCSISIYA